MCFYCEKYIFILYMTFKFFLYVYFFLTDVYSGFGIGITGLIAENLICHPFMILRRQCQVSKLLFIFFKSPLFFHFTDYYLILCFFSLLAISFSFFDIFSCTFIVIIYWGFKNNRNIFLTRHNMHCWKL